MNLQAVELLLEINMRVNRLRHMDQDVVKAALVVTQRANPDTWRWLHNLLWENP